MPPPPPGHCRVICGLFGWSNTKQSIRIVVDVPCSLPRMTSTEQYMYLLCVIQGIRTETKHSGSWRCFACGARSFFFLVCPSTLDLNRVILAGKPAHVILHSPMSNLYGKDPLVYDVAHALCRNGGSCRKRVDVWDKAWARLMGLTPPLDLSPANEKPPKEPLAKSCAVCNKLGTMRACGKCKLIRYCGKECQIADWKRHKTICNLVSLKKKMMVTRQLLT